MQSAVCQTHSQNLHEAATEYVSAANCLRKISAKDACSTLQEAIEISTGQGRFNIAARHQKEVAKIFERFLFLSLERMFCFSL